MTAAIVAPPLASALFALFPSFGPDTGIPALRAAYVHDLAGLGSGTLPSLDVMLLKGVIAFPSFHAVLAMLFTAAHARLPSLVWPVATLNTVMLLALPSQGSHYLVDVPAGVALGLFAIWLIRISRPG